MADYQGVEASHLEIAPVTMRDAAGRDHEFHFRYIPAPRGIEAFELVDGAPGGYQFQVPEEDGDPKIVSRLLARMRRALVTLHLEARGAPPGGHALDAHEIHRMSIKGDVVRGRIEWDSDPDSVVPTVVVDGESFTWEAFGRMLTDFEGWQFRLRIIDRSDEV